MAHDIGVNAFGEVKPNGESAGIGVGIVIRHEWKAGGIREADGDWSGFAVQMRGFGERGRRGKKE